MVVGIEDSKRCIMFWKPSQNLQILLNKRKAVHYDKLVLRNSKTDKWWFCQCTLVLVYVIAVSTSPVNLYMQTHTQTHTPSVESVVADGEVDGRSPLNRWNANNPVPTAEFLRGRRGIHCVSCTFLLVYVKTLLHAWVSPPLLHSIRHNSITMSVPPSPPPPLLEVFKWIWRWNKGVYIV